MNVESQALAQTGRGPATEGRGFSLVEMLVVIAIMAVLATIGMPLAELSHQRTKEEELRRALRDIRGALDAYKRLVDEGRVARAADGSGYPPSLDALTMGVPDAKGPPGRLIYVMRSLPRDPFAPADLAIASETWAPRSYASPPTDPRAGNDVFDVHSRSAAVGLNGRPVSTW